MHVKENYCDHKYFSSEFNRNASLCQLCGVVLFNKVVFTKPSALYSPLEYDKLQELTHIKSSLMKKSEQIYKRATERRADIVKYLKELSEYCKIAVEIFYVALNLFDELLYKYPKLQKDLTAISYKFCSLIPSLPDYSKFIQQDGSFFSRTDILQQEQKCLFLLDYKINTNTAYYILNYFFSNGFDVKTTMKIYKDSLEVLDYFVCDVRSLDFTEAEVAISSLILAFTSNTTEENCSKIRKTFADLYEIRSDCYMNAFFVLRSISKPKMYYQPEIEKTRRKDKYQSVKDTTKNTQHFQMLNPQFYSRPISNKNIVRVDTKSDDNPPDDLKTCSTSSVVSNLCSFVDATDCYVDCSQEIYYATHN